MIHYASTDAYCLVGDTMTPYISARIVYKYAEDEEKNTKKKLKCQWCGTLLITNAYGQCTKCGGPNDD